MRVVFTNRFPLKWPLLTDGPGARLLSDNWKTYSSCIVMGFCGPIMSDDCNRNATSFGHNKVMQIVASPSPTQSRGFSHPPQGRPLLQPLEGLPRPLPGFEGVRFSSENEESLLAVHPFYLSKALARFVVRFLLNRS
jgi:hypothetical protein